MTPIPSVSGSDAIRARQAAQEGCIGLPGSEDSLFKMALQDQTHEPDRSVVPAGSSESSCLPKQGGGGGDRALLL